MIAHEVESFGGEINAFTSFDYTCYYINTPVNYLEKTVEILLDMVSNPIFSQDDLVPERQVVFEEYRRSIDNPGQFNFKNMQETSFSTGYSHQILGTEKTILNQTCHHCHHFKVHLLSFYIGMCVLARIRASSYVQRILVVTGGDSGDSVVFKWLFLSPPAFQGGDRW
jgi:zinc protease